MHLEEKTTFFKRMGLKPELDPVPAGTLPRQGKKTRRLIDERKY